MSKSQKKQQVDSARQRAEQMRLEAEARSRRTRGIIIGASIAVVAVMIVAVFAVVQNARQQQAAASKGPAGLSQNGGLLTGQESAKVTVTQFTDFMCPACKQWEATYGPAVDQLEKEGKVKVEHVPVAILDRFSSGTEYSTRSASAAFCVMESDKDKYPAFLKAMYDGQPEENSTGLTTAQIADIAKGAGVSEAGQACIKAEKYKGYATKVTEDASKAGLTGTPYILINGKAVDSAKGESFPDKMKAAGVPLPGA